MRTLLLLFAIFALPLSAEDKKQFDLGEIETALGEKPNDPMLHYRKCQALFAEGREQDSIDHAAVTLEKFKEANNDLAWMIVGSIDTPDYRIDVHYNMGRGERAKKRQGIVRPYSFRVWTKGDQPDLIRRLDFELAYFDGEIMSAAVGEMIESGHANLGIVDPKSNFETIKKKVLEIVAK